MVCLLTYSLIIILPALVHGYIYPTNGTDTAMHLSILKSGNYWNQLYYAYVIVGYPLKIFGNWNVSFFWFNIVALVLVGYSFYFVLSRLVNWKAGLLGLGMLLLIGGIWSEYQFGEIFNVINIGIIFMWLLYFSVQWYRQRKSYQIVIIALLAILFGIFHSSGVYLLPLSIALSLLYLGRNLYKKYKVERSVLGLLSIVVVISTLTTCLIAFRTLHISSAEGWMQRIPILHWTIMLTVISPITLVVLGVLLVSRFRINLSLVILYVFAAILLVLSFGASPYPDRNYYDLVTVVGLIVACLLGMALERKKDTLSYMMVALIVFGIIIGLPTNWFTYHSSIELPDKQAIEYLNTLDARTFSCNLDVNLDIYGNYIKEGYVENGGDIIIERNREMGGQLIYHDLSLSDYIDGYQLTHVFQEGKVNVEIFRRIDK